MTNVLSCFFPTTVVLVDDSSAFLESLKDCLDIKYVTFKTFSNPMEAVEYVNEVSSTNRLDYTDLIRDGEDSLSDWKSILLNVNCLHREIYNPNRFSRISTIVVDYLMPGMDGIDLCSRIDDRNIQRILLTGVADEKVAIDAFNEGRINRFVKKGSVSFENEVTDSISKSMNQYFCLHTDDISKHLSVLDRGHLSDPIFADFFFSKCFRGDMIEYYMLDTLGSYLFMNEVGKMSMLSVLTEHELCRMTEIAIESEEISEEVLTKLQSRKYILVSHERTGLLPPVSQWSQYLREAHRLDGYQTYYFAISDEKSLDVDFNDIQTFRNFKRRRDF
ncbi:MAG: response regulator [Holosporaceae bacterium]|jgi:CheY-like chemotaxis protein|nr:response regulator [Holosporaceae bacterium]